MADTILITCPDCKKQMKVPDTLAGKKVRCKGCQAAVPVPGGKAKAPAKAVDTRVTTPAAQAKIAAAREDEEDQNPYGVTFENLAARCPHYAQSLDPPDSRICLNCGYDMVKRDKTESKKVYERTAGDFIMWQLPTVGCFLGILATIAGILYYHFWLPKVILSTKALEGFNQQGRSEYFNDTDNAEFSAYMFHWGIEVWLIVIGLGIFYRCGRFIVVRGFMHFLPTERIKLK